MLGLVWFCLVSCFFSVSLGQTALEHDQKVVCYVATWAYYRPSKGRFTLDDVDPLLCTHLVYSFIGMDERTFAVKSIDANFDVTNGGFNKALSLRKINPKLKVTVAVGGWVEGSEKYSNMASTPGNRKAFIDSVVQLLHQYTFDGLDLDWEYPASRGGKPADKENFVLLCKELKEAFSKYGWIVTAAVGASRTIADSAYDLPRLGQYLDYIHLMAYDYHGKWDKKTGHNAPLYPRVDESEAEKLLNVNSSVRYYVQKGVPIEKFVLGLGLYGRTFLLNDTANPGIGAATMKSAFSGPYTKEDGFLAYNEICEKQLTERGWSIAWQTAHQAPYMFKDNMWVSFDDMNSLGLKVAFSQRLGLAGVMVWSIDTDDFTGFCSNKKFPLLRSINKNLVLHAPERFQEKINVISTEKPVPTTLPTVQKPGVVIPGDQAPGISIPEVHKPEIYRPEFIPDVHQPGISRPELIPDVRQPEIYRPELIPDVHQPGIYRPELIPDVYQPEIIRPEYTPDDSAPGVHIPEVYRPEIFIPGLHDPSLYPGDNLDGLKPIKTVIDFDVEDENEIDIGRYDPAEGRDTETAGSRSTFTTSITYIILPLIASVTFYY